MAFNALNIAEKLSHGQVVAYFGVSSASLLMYDYILTFADEVRFIWKEQMSFGNILFLLTRYLVFPHIAITVYRLISDTPASCSLWLHISGWMFIFGIAIAELIMAIRVWALWGRDIKMGAFLAISLGATIAISGVYYERFYRSESFLSHENLSLPFAVCDATGGNGTLIYVSFTSLMVFEMIILILTVAKVIKQDYTYTKFTYTFIQDGYGYFAAMFGISLTNVIILVSAPPEYATLLQPLQRVLHAVLSGRILLRLRQEFAKGTGNKSGSPSISELWFQESINGNTDLPLGHV